MHIQQLKIRNFRSLDVEVENLQPFTMLFGENGAGKSNVLAAIDAIFAPKLQEGFQPGAPGSSGPFYRGRIADFQHNYYRNGPCEIPFEIVLRTTKSDLNTRWPDGIASGAVVLPATLPEDRVRIGLKGHFTPVPGAIELAAITLDSASVNDAVVLTDINKPDSWLPALSNKATSEKAPIVEQLLVSLTASFSTIGIARFLQKEGFYQAATQPPPRFTGDSSPTNFQRRLFDVKHSTSQSDQNRFRRVRDLFNQATGWGEIEFAQSDTDLGLMTWDKNKLWLPIGRRGSGAEQLLVILSEVVLRGAPIVGIEELESNLDEEHQKQLHQLVLGLVSTKGTGVDQVVATAHSVFFGHELDSREKWFVTRNGEGRTIVEPWSPKASERLFRLGQYQLKRQLEQDAITVAKIQAKRNRSDIKNAPVGVRPSIEELDKKFSSNAVRAMAVKVGIPRGLKREMLEALRQKGAFDGDKGPVQTGPK